MNKFNPNGSLRGYVSEDSCVSDDSYVSEDSRVDGGSFVTDGSRVEGGSRVDSRSRVGGGSIVTGESCVVGDSCVMGGSIVTRDPIVLHGLGEYPVTITDDRITIGCQTHSASEWRQLLPELAPQAPRLAVHAEALFAIAAVHQETSK